MSLVIEKLSTLAARYAKSHLETDPGLSDIIYLPANAPEREIRLIEVNKLMPARLDGYIEPLNFGIETGTENAHRLSIIDVTPDQWRRIAIRKLKLPLDWSLDGAFELQRGRWRLLANHRVPETSER